LAKEAYRPAAALKTVGYIRAGIADNPHEIGSVVHAARTVILGQTGIKGAGQATCHCTAKHTDPSAGKVKISGASNALSARETVKAVG
jgi:hypothetical protein